MSRRRRRSARAQSGPSPIGGVDIAWVVGLCVVGIVVGILVGPRFFMPEPIRADLWHVVSPGLDEDIQDPALGRGVYIEEGALTLRQHAFHRAEILSPKATTEVSRIEVMVLSGAVRLNFRSVTGNTFAILGPELAQTPMAGREAVLRPRGQPWVVEVIDGVAALSAAEGVVPLGPVSEGRVELTAISDEVRISGVRLSAADGQPVLEEMYAETSLHLAGVGLGGVLGLLLGVLSRLSSRGSERPVTGAVETLLLLALPAVVCVIPSAWWLYAVERMYLVRTPAWELARLSLLFSLLPAVSLGCLRSGLLVPREHSPPLGLTDRQLWMGVSVMAALLAAVQMGLSVSSLIVTVVGLGFLWMPFRIAKAAGLSPTGALVVDAPAQLAVLSGGWGVGLVAALGWRLLTLIAAAGTGLLRQAPRPVSDQLFVMFLLLPVSVELALRSSYLERGWDLARLSGDLASSEGWRDPEPFWAGDCGTEGHQKRVLWMGGSSTGGAYQFRSEPTAFYPAQAHQLVCDGAPASSTKGIRSENYGDGGRDTFTVSRSLADIADRGELDLVVVYTGVNDVMTMSSAKTRQQRETERAERDAAMSGLSRLSAQSRLLTGLSLLMRPLHSTEGARVPEVPLSDAEQNFETIARVAAERGAQVLLLTELVRQEDAGQLEEYGRLQARVAARHDHVTHLDLRPLLRQQGPWDDREALVDRNHLSRSGSARVGAAIAPTLAALLDIEMSQVPNTLDVPPSAGSPTVDPAEAP